MSNSFFQGAGYAVTGLRWLPKAGLRSVVLIPLLINILLFGGGIWWSTGQFERLDQTVQGWLPTWLAWLHWLLWPLFHSDCAAGDFLHLFPDRQPHRFPFQQHPGRPVEGCSPILAAPHPVSFPGGNCCCPTDRTGQGAVFRSLGAGASAAVVRTGDQRRRAAGPGPSSPPGCWRWNTPLSARQSRRELSRPAATSTAKMAAHARHRPRHDLLLTLIPGLNLLVMPAAVITAQP